MTPTAKAAQRRLARNGRVRHRAQRLERKQAENLYKENIMSDLIEQLENAEREASRLRLELARQKELESAKKSYAAMGEAEKTEFIRKHGATAARELIERGR